MSKSQGKKVMTVLLGTLPGGAKNRIDAMAAVHEKNFNIMSGKIKDDLCNYTYEVLEGPGMGDVPKVPGTNLIKDEMKTAMAQFNVHLAVIDEVFKYKGLEIVDIDKMHGHELSLLFHVTGFVMKGNDDYESIILTGNKYLSTGSRMDLETPPIPLDESSSYTWWNELKVAADAARLEIALYKCGYYTPVKADEDEEEISSKKQGKLFDKSASEEAGDQDFENAKVK